MSFFTRFENKISMEPNTGCWLWAGNSTHHGYGYVWVNDYVRKIAHRVAWELYVGPIPAGLYVLHKCDTRACVNPLHLFVGTAADNTKDCINKGRFSSGERHWHSKLSVGDILAIRKDSRRQQRISEDYGVNQQTVSAIKNHTKWKHVKDDEVISGKAVKR
jgi:hypothetical protein